VGGPVFCNSVPTFENAFMSLLMRLAEIEVYLNILYNLEVKIWIKVRARKWQEARDDCLMGRFIIIT
jgi:hypothetical protein